MQISNNITIGPDIDITQLIKIDVPLKTGFPTFDYNCKSGFPPLTLILGRKEIVCTFLNTIQSSFAIQRQNRRQRLSSYGSIWGSVKGATNQFIDYKNNGGVVHARYNPDDPQPTIGVELIDFREILIENEGIGFVSKANPSYSDIALADLVIQISNQDLNQTSLVSSIKHRNLSEFKQFLIGYDDGCYCYEI